MENFWRQCCKMQQYLVVSHFSHQNTNIFAMSVINKLRNAYFIPLMQKMDPFVNSSGSGSPA